MRLPGSRSYRGCKDGSSAGGSALCPPRGGIARPFTATYNGVHRAWVPRTGIFRLQTDDRGSMREPTRRGTGSSRGARPQGETRGSGAPGRSPAVRAADLQEMADTLEEQGRALLSQARQLQRMAASLERSGEGGSGGPRSRPSGGERSTPRRSSSGREERGRKDEESGRPGREVRGRKKSGNAPSWAPSSKKKKS